MNYPKAVKTAKRTASPRAAATGVFIQNPDLQNKSATFRLLGESKEMRGTATGRETRDSIEVRYYQPITVLIPKSRVAVNRSNVEADSPLATWLTAEKPKRMTNKTFSPTGWMVKGARNKTLFCYKVGSGRKYKTLESRQEEVLVFLLNKLRVPCQEIVQAIEAFRAKPEPALDLLVQRGILTPEHLEVLLDAEVIDWEVEAIVDRLGIKFET